MLGKAREDKRSRKEFKKVLTEVAKELQQRPPVIGLVGVSGVGKSSTINKIFKTNLATSDTVACTKQFWTIDVEAAYSQGAAKTPVALRIVDAPGLGEDISRDREYLEMYHEHLPQCDVILWILTARNRAISLDQQYLKDLKEFHSKMVFGLNQVDLTEPFDWNQIIDLPSLEQKKNIDIIVNDRRERLQDMLGRPIKLIPYSAKLYFDPALNYNLGELFVELVDSAPEHRAWIFSALRAFGPDDWIPKAVREYMRKPTEPAPTEPAPTEPVSEIAGDQIGDANSDSNASEK